MDVSESSHGRIETHSGIARQGHSGDIPTYYDLPSVKQSLYGWKVSIYIWIASISGASQILATAAEFADREVYGGVIRNARYIALGGSVGGAALLIIDLHTPTRFYNMLRIFRPTSPMSIGSYILISFGALSALLAAAQLRRDLGGEPGGFDTLARGADTGSHNRCGDEHLHRRAAGGDQHPALGGAAETVTGVVRRIGNGERGGGAFAGGGRVRGRDAAPRRAGRECRRVGSGRDIAGQAPTQRHCDADRRRAGARRRRNPADRERAACILRPQPPYPKAGNAWGDGSVGRGLSAASSGPAGRQ